MIFDKTIAAIASSPGIGAIATLRVSGKNSFQICDHIFKHIKNNSFSIINNAVSHKSYFGNIIDGADIIDEVLITVFKNPHSFTGEDTVEISCHGSVYIQQRILELLIQHDADMAKPGEFTQRAFLNGKMDLSQAEAVADLIQSESNIQHKIAIKQLKGGFTSKLKTLRTELVNFSSLLELELDFSEEDVEFANRIQLVELIKKVQADIISMSQSFKLGNAIKKGISTVIAGEPNVGKSTLLNTLVNEDRAIVSEIAGTTRDIIEETINIEGVIFRFIDTAGLRETTDVIEKIGVEKSYEKITTATILLYVCDGSLFDRIDQVETQIAEASQYNVPFLVLINKSDLMIDELKSHISNIENCLLISAKNQIGLEQLRQKIFAFVSYDQETQSQFIVSNARHFESLNKANDSLKQVLTGIENQLSLDLIALELRNAIIAIGEITGEVSNDEILGNIFSKFCIGK